MNSSQRRYDSDLSDAQWELIKDFFPAPREGGRPRSTNLRRVCDAIFYLARTGCQWRYLPHDFPPWQTVYGYFVLLVTSGIWEKMNASLSREVRLIEEKREYPTAAIVDSQSIKSFNKGSDRGFDGGKLIKGRKRHMLVDTLGLVLGVVVTAANIGDRDGLKLLLNKIPLRIRKYLELIWADQGYTGEIIEWISTAFQLVLSIVKRLPEQVGFVLLPKRWMVERSFGWFNFYRRLSKDYEDLPRNSENIIYVSVIQIMLRRLAPIDSS
jgi:putative transposase